MSNKKITVSEDQFAEVLYRWLSKFITEESIKRIAEDLGLRIRNKRDFSKIFKELFILYIWLTVYSCEEGPRGCNACLSIFHRLVYERHIEQTGEDRVDWLRSIGTKYTEYSKAMRTDHPSGPLWVVASLVNKKLFGEIKKDVWIQMRIITSIELFVKHLGKAIKQYEIYGY